VDYDPLLAKLIGYGTDRDQAMGRLKRALGEYFVGGIKTNISLFQRILCDPDFRAAKLDTGFLDRMLKRKEETRDNSTDSDTDPRTGPQPDHVAAIAAGMFAVLNSEASGAGERSAVKGHARSETRAVSSWKSAGRNEALR
jgi:acetyl-CoA carboxylase biotin carboxylase subunit